MTVYVDAAALLNFLVDLFLMVGTSRLAGFSPPWERLLMGSALGGIYSGLCLAWPRLGLLPIRLLVLILMALIAFGTQAQALRQGAVFLLLSMALGGMAVACRQARLLPLLLEGGLMVGLCQLAFGGQIGGREYVPVTLWYGDRELHLTALRDTGNSLRDPLTGRPVVVISRASAEKLTGLTGAQLSDPAALLCSGVLPGLRLIPCSTVGGSNLLPALRPSRMEIRGEPSDALIAFAREGLGEGQGYQALTGGIV